MVKIRSKFCSLYSLYSSLRLNLLCVAWAFSVPSHRREEMLACAGFSRKDMRDAAEKLKADKQVSAN